MSSKLIKLVLGCGLAAALAVPALACEFNQTAAKSDQVATQTTVDSGQTAQSQPTADTGSN